MQKITAVFLLLVLGAFLFVEPVRAQTAFEDPGARTGGSVPGDLRPVNDKIDAGEVAIASFAQVVILLRNDDTKPITTGAINLYPSSNITAEIGENQCAAAPINPGEVCAISVQVKGLQVGKYRIEMLLRHDGRTKLLTAAINGTVEKTGDAATDLISDIETIPTEIDFGALDESRSQSRSVIFRNKTSEALDISEIVIEAGAQAGFEVTSNCKSLKTGAACVASVKWSPQQKGPSTGTLIVRHSGPTEITTVNLKGTYNPTAAQEAQLFPQAVPGKGLLVSSQREVNFGSGISQSASITTSLVNIGDVPLTITQMMMANAENGVKIEKTGCNDGIVLNPLEACPFTLTWEPVREGTIVDDIKIFHSGARGILVIPIRGSASRAINKDSKAISYGSRSGPEAIISAIQPLSMNDILDESTEGASDGSGSAPAPSGMPANAAPQGGPQVGTQGGAPGASASAPASDKPGAGGNRSLGQTISPMPSSGFTSPLALTMQGYFPRDADVRGVLDGYVITSYAANRAIVTGPGGSRVVFDGEETVIGGVLWRISMRSSAIEFQSGDQKVLLLFDKSLSSINLVDGQSGGGNGSSNESSTIQQPAPAPSTTPTSTP